MKIKSMIMAFVAVMLLAACATTAPQQLSPAQVFAIACPPVQAAIVQFEAIDATLVGVPSAVKAEAALQKVQPLVAAACASGVTVSAASVQAFAETVLPALGQVAGSLPLPPAELAEVEAGLVAAEVAVGAVGVVEQQIKAAQAVPASASTVASPAK